MQVTETADGATPANTQRTADDTCAGLGHSPGSDTLPLTSLSAEQLSRIVDIVVEDMIRIERDLNIRPRDFPRYYRGRQQEGEA